MQRTWSYYAVLVAALWWGLGMIARDPAELKGQRVVVCGASKGIGRDLAAQYAQAGAEVVVVARPQSQAALVDFADELKSTWGATVHPVAVDLGTEVRHGHFTIPFTQI
jgi:hypothetical protein